MKQRIGSIAVWFGSMLTASLALAQSDPRDIPPYFVLVIDTSLSMEQLPDSESLPNCALSNDSYGVAPAGKKSRWTVALEALTGTFNNFECTEVPRNDSTVGVSAYDNDPTAFPYHQPWKCATAGANQLCSPLTTDAIISQTRNGILDSYGSRVQFGLMTFDGKDTYTGEHGLVPTTSFDLDRSESIAGEWSYGGKRELRYPGCSEVYAIDTGVRAETATEGYMVTLNSCPTPPSGQTCPKTCTKCPGDQTSLNTDIRNALLKVRPYGSTPIAGALTDLEYHLTHMTDGFAACRKVYALLLTDGKPDDDYYPEGCACGQPNEQACPTGADPSLNRCPYSRPEVVANRLVAGGTDPSGANHGPLVSRLFVVGMSVTDTGTRAVLNKIASAGCRDGAACITNSTTDATTQTTTNDYALFADNFNSLISNVTNSINQILPPRSHSVPVFAVGSGLQSKQYQIITGYQSDTEPNKPWQGLIERTRFECDGTTPVAQALNTTDRFQIALRTKGSQNQRNLITVTPTPASPTSYGDTQTSADCGGVTPCAMKTLASLTDPAYFGTPTLSSTDIATLKLWMQGGNSVRDPALGDIFHSSPVIIGSPRIDTSDEAYNLFRGKVANRPLTMYVNSNDGVLHAFSVEQYTGSTSASIPSYSAGEEMWGFIPPALLSKLQTNLQKHQILFDGRPTVRDVYFNRVDGTAATADDFHTVLITSTRIVDPQNSTPNPKSSQYIALDVTLPYAPKFLWQFHDDELGTTYAQAAIGQAVFPDANGHLKNGAIALIPGGGGDLDTLSTSCNTDGTRNQIRDGSTGSSPQFYSDVSPRLSAGKYPIRDTVRCWTTKGRALYILDVETGRTIATIKTTDNSANGPRLFMSPLVSTPSLYPVDIGAIASRAFVVDADGVIWRVDLTGSDPTAWTARPFHDIFWDKTAVDGQVSYEAPLLSIESHGRVVVLVGTGDTENILNPTAENRVVSVTEEYFPAATGTTASKYRGMLNWEYSTLTTSDNMQLVPSEFVTGNMALFNGQLFFGTFIPIGLTGNACASAQGRLHIVDFVDYSGPLNSRSSSSSLTNTYAPVRIAASTVASGVTNQINVTAANAPQNYWVMGLNITERPICTVTDQDSLSQDIYGQTYRVVKSITPPDLYLVAQTNPVSSTDTAQGLGQLQLKLTNQQIRSKVLSWAASVD